MTTLRTSSSQRCIETHLTRPRLAIGLFGLVGMFGVAMAPLVGRTIDGLVPWFASIVATLALLVFQAIAVGADGVNIGAIVVVCFGIDVFRQMVQVSLTTSVFGLDPTARARLNAVLLLSVREFCICELMMNVGAHVAAAP